MRNPNEQWSDVLPGKLLDGFEEDTDAIIGNQARRDGSIKPHMNEVPLLRLSGQEKTSAFRQQG